eukprot:g6254.t1
MEKSDDELSFLKDFSDEEDDSHDVVSGQRVGASSRDVLQTRAAQDPQGVPPPGHGLAPRPPAPGPAPGPVDPFPQVDARANNWQSFTTISKKNMLRKLWSDQWSSSRLDDQGVSRQQLEKWDRKLNKIIDAAVRDQDEWVRSLGRLLEGFPRTNRVNPGAVDSELVYKINSDYAEIFCEKHPETGELVNLLAVRGGEAAQSLFALGGPLSAHVEEQEESEQAHQNTTTGAPPVVTAKAAGGGLAGAGSSKGKAPSLAVPAGAKNKQAMPNDAGIGGVPIVTGGLVADAASASGGETKMSATSGGAAPAGKALASTTKSEMNGGSVPWDRFRARRKFLLNVYFEERHPDGVQVEDNKSDNDNDKMRQGQLQGRPPLVPHPDPHVVFSDLDPNLDSWFQDLQQYGPQIVAESFSRFPEEQNLHRQAIAAAERERAAAAAANKASGASGPRAGAHDAQGPLPVAVPGLNLQSVAGVNVGGPTSKRNTSARGTAGGKKNNKKRDRLQLHEEDSDPIWDPDKPFSDPHRCAKATSSRAAVDVPGDEGPAAVARDARRKGKADRDEKRRRRERQLAAEMQKDLEFLERNQTAADRIEQDTVTSLRAARRINRQQRFAAGVGAGQEDDGVEDEEVSPTHEEKTRRLRRKIGYSESSEEVV